MKLSGWGRHPILECMTQAPRDLDALRAMIERAPGIARGNGRAYGDSALNTHNTIQMRHFSHMLDFNSESGQLVTEAGVLLDDVIQCFLPRGWFPAVTPGTRFVTIGGMVAADVHGKNHHKHGSFGAFVDWIDLVDATGAVRRCSREEHAELFEWTIGGMGLTGIILRVAFRLKPVETGWIRQETYAAPNLDGAIDLFEETLDATYSVAWIDCLSSGPALGRSIVMLGEHADRAELSESKRKTIFPLPGKSKLNVPFNAPRFCLNRFSMRLFNSAYYHGNARKEGTEFINWASYFYPLDAVLNWNRLYGRKGFNQFQCVLPLAQSRDGIKRLLEEISASGRGSFLAVLKRFGPQDSRFSFPMEGYTLALDFPRSAETDQLLTKLEHITVTHGGRIYLAKDSHISAPNFLQSDETRIRAFQGMRLKGPGEHFTSSQSERLEL